MTLGIIDADSMCYFASKESIEESYSNIDSLFSNIVKYNQLTHYYIFLSEGQYFRHIINNEYKNKRPVTVLKYIKELKQYLIEKYGAISFDKVEADDMVAFTSLKYSKYCKTVICSPDKDVLKQISGTHFNYKNFERTITSERETYRFVMLQTLMGDSTDNIKGIPGIGEGKANKILNQEQEDYKYPQIVLNEYIKHYKYLHEAIYQYQLNFRQVYLLRTEKDFINEVGYVPEIGNPIKI